MLTDFDKIYLRLMPPPEGFPLNEIESVIYFHGNDGQGFEAIACCVYNAETTAWAAEHPTYVVHERQLEYLGLSRIFLTVHSGEEARAAYHMAVKLAADYHEEIKRLRAKYIEGVE